MSIRFKEIIEEELKTHVIRPSVRKFAEWLGEGLSKEGDQAISHPMINHWKNGKAPNTDLLEDMLSVYPGSDRRFQFALKMLAAKSPHIWGPNGVVWSLKEKLPTTK